MLIKVLVGAVFAHVAMTLALLGWLGMARARAVRLGEVRISEIALSSDAWPDRIKQIANSFRNQFELPLLFYVAALLAIVTSTYDVVIVVLSWCFVVLRFAHAIIHVTNNNVMNRFRVYGAGFMVLAALWVYIGVRVMLAGVV